VERKNPSMCATVNWEVCKSAIALYGLYVNVIKRSCNQSPNNPVIQTRICLISHVYHPACDSIFTATLNCVIVLFHS
jgi:hypothetical protein